MAFFRDIKDSILHFSFYHDFAQRSVGRAVKFLLGLVVLITVILAPRISWDAMRWIRNISEWMQNNLPEITVTNGEANSPVAQPFKVAGEKFVFILDTSGATTDIDAGYPAGILVTKKQVILKESAFQKREYDLAQLSGLTLNKETIAALKRTADLFAIPLIVLGLLSYFFLAKLTQVLFFSLISLIVNAAGGIGLSYRSLFVIGSYALTPAVLLGALVGLIGKPLPLFAVLYLSLYLVYLIVGVLQSKK